MLALVAGTMAVRLSLKTIESARPCVGPPIQSRAPFLPLGSKPRTLAQLACLDTYLSTDLGRHPRHAGGQNGQAARTMIGAPRSGYLVSSWLLPSRPA